MSFLVFFTLFLNQFTVKTQNFDDKIFCSQFDNNNDLCESQFENINNQTDCDFVSLNSTTSEQVCVPDNCAQYVNNQSGCDNEVNCIWQDDPNTNITLFRCFPR